ncbi:FecR/PupR family sigma factor regulator [Pseudomonas sp. ADAK20]
MSPADHQALQQWRLASAEHEYAWQRVTSLPLVPTCWRMPPRGAHWNLPGLIRYGAGRCSSACWGWGCWVACRGRAPIRRWCAQPLPRTARRPVSAIAGPWPMAVHCG